MMFRRMMVVGFLLHSIGAGAEEQAITLDVAIERTNAIFDQVEALARQIDISPYDFDAILDDLLDVSHPDEILDWVRSNIAFEAYPGVLRGPQGTLLSRAGNSLDQALLLAKLLKDAGFDARVVRSRLSTGAAKSLVHQMQLAAVGPTTDMTHFKDMLEETIGKYSARPEDSASLLALVERIPDSFPIDEFEISENVSDLSRQVSARLAASGFEEEPADDSELVEESRDYFWTQYRAAAQGSWSSGHPAFTDGTQVPKNLDPLEIFADSIPEALQHRVRIEVILEQKLGEARMESAVMPPWERPAANLVGIPLTYANQPDGLNFDNLSKLKSYEAAIGQTKFFMPVFNGSIPDGAKFFGLNGFTVPADVAGSPYAALFDTVASKATLATTAVSEIGGTASDGAAARLIGQYLRISLISPTGDVRRFERPIWREQSGNEDQVSQVLSALASSHTIMLAVGRYPPPYVMNRLIGWMSSKRSETLALIRLSYAGVDDPATTRNFDDAGSWVGHLLAFSMFDAGADTIANLSYRSSPNVAIYREFMNPLLRMPRTFDVVANDRRTFVTDKRTGRLVASKDRAVGIGIWESSIEGVALGGSNADTSVLVFQRATEEGVPLRVATAEHREAIATIEMPTFMRDTISSQLDSGYFVVIPESIPKDAERHAWLRVDPRTGNALGYLESGVGGSIEYSIVKQVAGGVAASLLCIAILSSDQNGLTRRDALQCGLFGIAAAMGGISMVAGSFQYEGAAMVAAWLAVFAGVGGLAMDSFDDPAFDQPL